jgi:hypothetical protein
MFKRKISDYTMTDISGVDEPPYPGSMVCFGLSEVS